jgi:hypothetical protein
VCDLGSAELWTWRLTVSTAPAPALIYTAKHFLLNPRLTTYLDVKVDSYLYAFVQARVDRAFDPSDEGAQIRLDEYAIRITPVQDEAFPRIEIGKFATVVGNWVRRHGSWENPFIDAPLPYENLVGLWDIMAPDSAATLLYWGQRSLRWSNQVRRWLLR